MTSREQAAAAQGVAGLVLVAPAIVALRLSRQELAAELEGVTDEVERDRVTAKFADFSSNPAGNLMCGSRHLIRHQVDTPPKQFGIRYPSDFEDRLGNSEG